MNKYLLKHRIYLIFLIFITLSSFQFFILFVNASDPTVEKWPIQGDYTPPYGGTLKTRDNVDLATLVYHNKFFWESSPGPIIMVRTPYDISTSLMDLTAWNFVNNYPGSYVVTQDMRGRFHSSGVDMLFGSDWQDGYDTYLYLKNDPTLNWMWNGKLSSYGASAVCINQYCYAGEDIPELVAQYLSVGSPEQYDHIFFQGGQYCYNTIKKWSMGQGTASWNYARDTIATHPKKDSWWAKRSLEMGNRFANVHASAIHYGGWDDVFSEGTIRGFVGYNYEGASDARGHQFLVMAGIGHGAPVGDISWPNAASPPAEVGGLESFLLNTELFNSNGPRGSEQYNAAWNSKNKVFYYVYSDPAYAGVDPLACSWRVTNDWPVPSTPQRWYLNKGTTQHTGILSLNPPSTAESQSYVYNPSNPCPTNGGNNLYDTHVDNSDVKIGQGSTDQRGNGFYYNNGLPNIVSRSDVITFTSEALENPYEFAGNVKTKLYVQSNCPDTDFVAKLIDVFPDGREMLVTDGILRACRMNGFDTTTWMSPGVTYEINVDLWSKAWRFQPGHKIKLLITSSNYPRFLRNPNKADEVIPTTLGTYNIATNTIMLSPSYPSYLQLPIVDGWIESNAPNIWITSSVPSPSPSTSYVVKWSSENVETVDILLNGGLVATGQPPINTITGYQVNGLTSNTDNTITVIGYKTGKTPKNDSIVIHPYISPPSITILHPEIDEIYYTSSVEVNWSINSENSGGLSALWIESDTIPKTQISASLTKYTLNYLETGYHWVNITAVGVNGLISSANHSFYVDMESPQVWITSGQAELGSTEYTVKWGALNVEYINITVNGEVNASYLPANSPTGYLITNLIDDIDYEIQVIGYKTGFSEAIDSINIHPYVQPPQVTILNPSSGQILYGSQGVTCNFSIIGYVKSYWIECSGKPTTRIINMTSSYQISYDELVHGINFINLTALGYNNENVSNYITFNFDKARVDITATPWGYSNKTSFRLVWSNQHCKNFRIKVNGAYYGDTYDNNTEFIDILGLIPNVDNIIEVIGVSTDYDNEVSDTYIAHPYTNNPICIIWNPLDGETIPWRFYLIQWYENDTAVKNAGGIDYIVIRTSVSDDVQLAANIRMYRVEGLKQGSNWIRLTIVGKNGQIHVSQITLIVNDPAVRQRMILITVGSCAAGAFALGMVFLKIKKKRLRAVNAEWNEIFGKEAETGTPYKTDFNFDEDILEEEKVSEVKSDSNEIKEAPPPESNTNDPDKNSDDNSDEDSDALIKPH